MLVHCQHQQSTILVFSGVLVGTNLSHHCPVLNKCVHTLVEPCHAAKQCSPSLSRTCHKACVKSKKSLAVCFCFLRHPCEVDDGAQHVRKTFCSTSNTPACDTSKQLSSHGRTVSVLASQLRSASYLLNVVWLKAVFSFFRILTTLRHVASCPAYIPSLLHKCRDDPRVPSFLLFWASPTSTFLCLPCPPALNFCSTCPSARCEPERYINLHSPEKKRPRQPF